MRGAAVLGLYTAGEPASAGLCAAGKEAGRTLPAGGTFEHLLPVARELLDEAGLAPGALDGVAVASGPGSFTGLRIGAAAALGLARAAGIRLYAVDTGLIWAALLMRGVGGPALCRVALDARRGEVYMAGYGLSAPAGAVGGAPELFDGPVALQPAAALQRIEPDAAVVGDGRELLVAAGLDPRRAGFSRPPEAPAIALARLAAGAPERYARAPQSFTLSYVRDPQAVVRRRAPGTGRPGSAPGSDAGPRRQSAARA